MTDSWLSPKRGNIVKAFCDYWASLLAFLFTYINVTGQIPVGCKNSVAIPLFRKGDSINPATFSPINVTDIGCKLHT